MVACGRSIVHKKCSIQVDGHRAVFLWDGLILLAPLKRFFFVLAAVEWWPSLSTKSHCPSSSSFREINFFNKFVCLFVCCAKDPMLLWHLTCSVWEMVWLAMLFNCHCSQSLVVGPAAPHRMRILGWKVQVMTCGTQENCSSVQIFFVTQFMDLSVMIFMGYFKGEL